MTNISSNVPESGLVQVTVHRKPHCQVELHVKAHRPLLEQAKKKAVKSVGKEIEVPGFRKGKAPEEIVFRKYPQEIEKNQRKALADLAFVEAQKIAKVPVLNNNTPITFDLKEQTPEEADLVFSFETEPNVPTVDPKRFVPKPVERLPIGEKEVEEAIRQMRFFYAEWKPIADRAVQEGDFVVLDLETFENGVPRKVFDHIRFEVVPERMARWMQNLLLNARAGDILDGMSEPDADAPEEEKKNIPPKAVRIHLLRVEKPLLPELDDTFAAKVGAENVERMRTSTANILNQKADEQVRQNLRKQVDQFLVETYPFDLPRSMVVTESQYRLKKLAQERKDWDEIPPHEMEKIEAEMKEEASRAIRLFYLSHKIVQEAKIPITQQLIQEEAMAALRSLGIHRPDPEHLSKDVFAMAFSQVVLTRAQDYVISMQKT